MIAKLHKVYHVPSCPSFVSPRTRLPFVVKKPSSRFRYIFWGGELVLTPLLRTVPSVPRRQGRGPKVQALEGAGETVRRREGSRRRRRRQHQRAHQQQQPQGPHDRSVGAGGALGAPEAKRRRHRRGTPQSGRAARAKQQHRRPDGGGGGSGGQGGVGSRRRGPLLGGLRRVSAGERSFRLPAAAAESRESRVRQHQ